MADTDAAAVKEEEEAFSFAAAVGTVVFCLRGEYSRSAMAASISSLLLRQGLRCCCCCCCCPTTPPSLLATAVARSPQPTIAIKDSDDDDSDDDDTNGDERGNEEARPFGGDAGGDPEDTQLELTSRMAPPPVPELVKEEIPD